MPRKVRHASLKNLIPWEKGIQPDGAGRPKGISENQWAFVLASSIPDEFGRFKTHADAYRQAYPKGNPELARNKAYHLLNANPHLRQEIEKAKAEAIADLTDQAMELPIARAELRFQNMQERYERLIELSRTDPAFNKQLMDAILALEESAAKQLGQYAPVKSDVKVSANLTALTDEELEQLERLSIKTSLSE